MKAVLCPVCNGTGKVNLNPIGTGANLETCHGCQGKGWVEVAEDILPSWILWPDYYTRTVGIVDNGKCPTCGSDRNLPAGTGCPMGSHYGGYCSIQ